jgi:integrase/recombinase XerD
LIYIRDILGHVDISTTEVYARADTEMKRVALEKANHLEQPSLPIWGDDKDLISWLKALGKSKN